MPSPAFTAAPRLETERLILRPHLHEDFPLYLSMWQDADFCRFIGGQPLAEEDAWTKMIRHMGHWAFLGFGYWALEEKATGEFIGEAGVVDFKRNTTPSLKGLQEAGWGLLPTAHGKGYASEALTALLQWRDKHFPALASACMISPENSPSLRLAERHGFHAWTEITYKGSPTLLLRRDPVL